MKTFYRLSAVLLWLSVLIVPVQAEPFGPQVGNPPAASEYHLDLGGSYSFQNRKMRTSIGEFETRRNEVYGTLLYTGFDWSAGFRAGVANFDDGSGLKDGYKPMFGVVAKALMVGDLEGNNGIGVTFHATRYLTNAFQDLFNVGLAVTAQTRLLDRITFYAGPVLSYGGGRRPPTDNTDLVTYAKETPLVGACGGVSIALPKSVTFEVESQYVGAFSTGATLRVPLWY